MAMHSGGTLAGAVSAAGGLGSFGGIHRSMDPDWIRSQAAIVRATTDRPFAIGFITDFIPQCEPLFEAALAERPGAVAFSFGDPGPYIDPCKAVGARVICQVQNFDQADRAVGCGADILVAQGNEAGGHTGSMGTLPLLAGIVALHPDIPTLAAGGIGDGRTLAAALIAGADGAWLGTAFLATPEAVEVDDIHKRLIVDSDGADTVFTRVYDIMSGMPWPAGVGERVRRNRFTDEWIDRESQLQDHREQVVETNAAKSSGDNEDLATREILYGQSAGLVSDVRPASEVVRVVCRDAERILRERPEGLLT